MAKGGGNEFQETLLGRAPLASPARGRMLTR
jgi:hypothetical protein